MVFVNDAKNSSYDMNFCPTQSDFESDKVAKDYAALLALVEVQSKMPLENKLPEPYRSVWKELIASKKDKEMKDKKKGGAKAEAALAAKPALAREPRKLPPAPKDFMFSGGDEEDEPDLPMPPALAAIGTLDPSTAD